ncbi:Hypothetical protein NCS54_00897000 [Fusarium falciforme]|uniref:Hypothetical protein n=1 Tax=Fusarium falciforme TaxID=195108 RepID=UPI002301E294|nr:Hypothetical protein NCS54_00897000 [Fusarium falciforme]WAO91495.1 Hypothetical protein NCS54_00897000 [Fusarium falciforme]
MGLIADNFPILNNSVETGEGKRAESRYYPKDQPWNPHRPVRIIIVGAGIGGVAQAVLLSHKVPNATIVVYDRLDRIGGTWAANVYPGVRCDVPSHAYQLTLKPNTQWSEYYPKGSEIQQYYEGVVRNHGLEENFKLQHEVLRATWLTSASQWAVEVRNLRTGDVSVDTAEFLVNCQGRISKPKVPNIPHLDAYKGPVVHTARWPADLDLADKTVAVVGAGASAAQLIPNIAPRVRKIVNFVRSKTWVSPTFIQGIHEATGDAPGGPPYSPEQRAAFQEDPAAYVEHRREFEMRFQTRTIKGADKLGSKENAALRERIIETMRDRLGGDEEWLQRLLPDYAPGCKRLTPAPGYLETLRSPKVDYITERITQLTPTGVQTAGGAHHEVDVVILATGFESSFTTLFPVIGKDGIDLREKWSPDGEIGYPETYPGIMAPGFPNYFFVLQAQGNARGGSVPLHIETSGVFIAKAVRKIQSQSYAALDAREEAAQEFNDVVGGFFENSVTGDACRSWFKSETGPSRLLIAWPGSYHHRAGILRDPRWEDFTFEARPGATRNRFEYFGDGTVEKESRPDRDPLRLTSYLTEIGKIDLATYQESWTLDL